MMHLVFGRLSCRALALRLAMMLVLCLQVGLAARAETARVPTIDLDYAVSDDPRSALKRADAWMQQGLASGNRVQQLNALRLSAKANEQVEERPALERDVAAGLKLSKELGDIEAEAEFLTQRATLLAEGGNSADANRAFDEAIEFATRQQLPSNVAKAQAARAHMYILLDRAADALALLVEAHAYFETHNDRLGMAYTFSLMSQVFSLDPDEKVARTKAMDYTRRALAMMDPKRSRHDMGVHYHNLGVDLAKAREFVKAREQFEKGLTVARELGDRVSIAYLDYRLAELDREEGNLKQVLPALDRAMPVFVDTENHTMLLLSSVSQAKVLASLGKRREAMKALEQVQVLAQRLDGPWAKVRRHETAMALHSRWGEFEKAFREAELLRAAEAEMVQANNARQVAELERRFDSRQKEIEDQLLRARQQESDARRLALILGLVLAITLVSGVAVFFARQAQRNRRFETLALRDELTGLPNRRSIMEFARAAVRRSPEAREPVTIALIDLDHFKAINDEFGHAQGDAVLTAFAEACQAELRSVDRLGRFGGEEFLLVMPGSGSDQMAQVFQRLRAALQTLEIKGLPPGRKLTFSMGAVSTLSTADSLDELIQRADRALYLAKENGRDRLESGQVA